MKKVIFIALILNLLVLKSYALDTALFDMHNRILQESKGIRASLANTKDVVLVNSMWDSCLLTINQLEAYFSMVGIFNNIKQENLNDKAVSYLINWLNGIKQTNELNIKGLDAIIEPIEPATKTNMEKLKAYFNDLNSRIDTEVKKIAPLKKALEKK